MSGTLRLPIRATRGFIVIAAMAFAVFVHAQSAKKISGSGAYRAKYKGSPYLRAMISARPRTATARIAPRLA